MEGFKVFYHEKFGSIRVIEKDGIAWFVSIDVCNALGYKRANDAIRVHVDKEDIFITVIHRNEGGNNSNMITINESGLYSLIMSSKLPSAKEFKHWVTSEVLPTLRKTGHYDMGNQSNSVFNSINKLEDHAINGSARSTLNDLIKMYAKMSNIHMSNAWMEFEHCYNNAYRTNLSVSRRAYQKKYNNGKAISNPKYLEAIGKIDGAIAVANQMIDERHSTIIQSEEFNRRNIEISKHMYANQFVQGVMQATDSMNYRTDQSRRSANNIICVSMSDIPKEYRKFITLRYPFYADLEAAYKYAYDKAASMYNY